MSIEYLDAIWEGTNQNLKKQNLYRDLLSYQNLCEQGVVDFSSNDYLSLRNDIRIKQAGFEAVLKSGAGTGASRSIVQTDEQIENLETFFCEMMGFKQALFLPSGFLANITFFDVLSPFASETIDQEIFVDHRAHASIFFALKSVKCRHSVFRHDDYRFLEKKLASSTARAKIIVVESLYSMDGDFSDADALAYLCEKYGALVFIDETHTFGVYGKHGIGFINSHPKLKPFVIASMFGCGKAVGVCGGFLATQSSAFRERVLQKSKVFIYSTGISPFITGAVRKSLEIIFSDEGDAKRSQLQDNVDFLKTKLPNVSSHIVPVILGSNIKALQVSQELLKNKMIVRAIRSPSVPKGTERIRIVLNSGHSMEQIDKIFTLIPRDSIL